MNQDTIAEEHIHDVVIDIIAKHFYCSRRKAAKVEPRVYEALITISDVDDLKQALVYELLLRLAGTQSAEECADEIIALNFSSVSSIKTDDDSTKNKKDVSMDAYLKILARAGERSRMMRNRNAFVEEIGDEEAGEPSNNKIIKIDDRNYALIYNSNGNPFSPEQLVSLTRLRITMEDAIFKTKNDMAKIFLFYYAIYIIAHPTIWFIHKVFPGKIAMVDEMSMYVGNSIDYITLAVHTILAIIIFRNFFETPAKMILFNKGTFKLRTYRETELNGAQVLRFNSGDDVDIFLHKRSDVNKIASEDLLIGALEAFSATLNPTIDKAIKHDDLSELEPNMPVEEILERTGSVDDVYDVKIAELGFLQNGDEVDAANLEEASNPQQENDNIPPVTVEPETETDIVTVEETITSSYDPANGSTAYKKP